jgi:MFS family permease
MSAGMFGAIAYIPLFVQGGIGVSPSVSGYILTPLMLSVVVTSSIGGRLMTKFSYRAILIPSLVLMIIGFILLSQMTVDTTKLEIIIYMIITGLGMGAVYPTIGTAAQSAVEPRFRGVATSSSQFFRSIGGTIGVTVLGSLLAQRMTLQLVSMNREFPAYSTEQWSQFADPQLLLDAGARASLPQDLLMRLQHVFSQALHDVFFLGIIFVCISLAASFFMGASRLISKQHEKDLR